jgi:hypothetical protein
MKTKKSLQKKIKRGRTSKKYNVIKQKGGAFQIGDDVIDVETKERGRVIRIEESRNGDMVTIEGWNVRNPKVHYSHLKLYTEYESQERERKLFEAYRNKDNDPETYERLKQEEATTKLEEATAKQTKEVDKRKKNDEQQKAISYQQIQQLKQPFPRFSKGERFRNYITSQEGKIDSLRDDSYEKEQRLKDPTNYNYSVVYDDGTLKTYVPQDYMIKI